MRDIKLRFGALYALYVGEDMGRGGARNSMLVRVGLTAPNKELNILPLQIISSRLHRRAAWRYGAWRSDV